MKNLEFKVELRGIEKVREKVEQLGEKVPTAMLGCLHKFATEIVRHSQRNYVPVLTGALRASGFVRVLKMTKEQQAVEAGFGGFAHGKKVDYAVYVHERTELRHKVGSAKYLEKAISDKQEEFEEIASKYLKEHWGVEENL